MRKFRSERGKDGKLPLNLTAMPQRVRRVLGSALMQIEAAETAQREFAAEAQKIRADGELTQQGKTARVAALLEQRIPKLREYLTKGRAFMAVQVNEIETELERHLQRRPLGDLPKLPDGASLEARLTRQAIATTRELLLEQRKRRVEDDVDEALAKDQSGGELMRIAGLALGSGDEVDAHLWATAAPERVRRFGGQAAQTVMAGLVEAARERRIEQISDQTLLEELDYAQEMGSAMSLVDMLSKAIEQPGFVDEPRRTRELRLGFGALRVVDDSAAA